MYRPKPNHLAGLLAALVVAMLIACLWPFNFVPRNNVEWLQKEPGVRFTGMGNVVSLDPLPPLSQLSTDGSLTVQVTARPAKLTNRYVPYILSFHSGTGPSPLVIGAWRNSLIVRLGRAGGAERRQFREIGVGDALATGKTTVITVVAGASGTSVYLNGKSQRSVPNAFIETGEGDLGKLLIGMSPTAGNWWRGDILGLTIYGRSLTKDEVRESCKAFSSGGRIGQDMEDAIVASYDFSAGSGRIVADKSGQSTSLVIPSVFRPLRRVFLPSPSTDYWWSRSFSEDMILNILGFLPFGLLGVWNARARTKIAEGWRSAGVILSGCAFSLGVEVVQAFLPSRSSSLVDLCSNGVGTAVGVAVFFAFTKIKGLRLDA